MSENCGELIFYLDGAHSPESIDACAKWFSNAVKGYKNPSHLSISVENTEESSENGHFLHESKALGQFENSSRLVGVTKIIYSGIFSLSLTIAVGITYYIICSIFPHFKEKY